MPSFTLSDRTALRASFESELTGNILPFWRTRMIDRENGGFFGALTNDLQIRNEEPRTAVLCARILWTFAQAHHRSPSPELLATAEWAYETLLNVFWDARHGGVYWSVDKSGKPVADRKHHYAQAFAIYGLTEFYRATGDARSLEKAQELFALLEQHAYEPVHGGYLEGSSREWSALADMRLSDIDLNCRKSMNTLLHILEAYSNLLLVWDDARLRARHRALLETFAARVIDAENGHLRLFFEEDWTPLSDRVSYGHDIEASWLICEAAERQGDAALRKRMESLAVRMADCCLREGQDADGGLFSEAGPDGLIDDGKNWWSQAEAVVGFFNAYELSGREEFARAALRSWDFIRENLVDPQHGDWFKVVDRNRRIDVARYKAGPWECPYHHSRMCFEMLDRLAR